MRRPAMGLVLFLLAQSFTFLCAATELALPSLEANGKTYTNVTVTSTSKNRVVVQHKGGLVTLAAADLTEETRKELIEAGVLREPTVKNEKPGIWGNSLTKSGQSNEVSDGSFATQIGSRFESEARSRSGVSPEKLVSMMSVTMATAVGIGFFALYCLRCWCLFRICKRGRGSGSVLVFFPLVRWVPLADAARMKRSLLWIPVFACVGLWWMPPLPKIQAVMFGYAFLVGALWLTTAGLFVIWCVKICKQLDCSSLFAVLLLLPVLDWVALLYLAFSEEKAEIVKAPAGAKSNRIQLAI